MELKDAPRELILRYVSEMEKQFELKPPFRSLKEMWKGLLEVFQKNGKCTECRAPIDGHFMEECVARRENTLAHIYMKRAATNAQDDPEGLKPIA